jgi:hypothetical protein
VTPRITAPPLNSDVAPPSLTMMCADSWHSTLPHGGHSADSASELAAVPLITGNTSACGLLEHLTHQVAQLGGDAVAAVGEGRAVVGRSDRGEQLRRNARRVVAAQFDGLEIGRGGHAVDSTARPRMPRC